LVLAGLAALVFVSLAGAAVPANDDVEQATDITSLPFATTVSLTEATAAAGDLDCSGIDDTHTVWYRITPQSDMRLGLRTVNEAGSEVSTTVASGEPGSFTQLQCSFSQTQALDVTAGTSYYIQLATAGTEPGPVVDFSIVRVAPLTVEIAASRKVSLSGGVATVSGTLRCSRTTPPGSETVVQGTLDQGATHGWLVPVHFASGCSEVPMRWRTTVQVLSGPGFVKGKASLVATGFACDAFICAEPDAETVTAKLR
ncbi:MAG: hypothetical protein M3301_09330, partial [Chloroflexota bacterium]|nr:hypothetical protein [Chloroflexota bacterium]